jgi:hypothetical protein
MLERNGFTIVQADMGFDYRSPLICFRKCRLARVRAYPNHQNQ